MTDPTIDGVFELLDKWRHLPGYQLERRADIYFAMFLPDVLRETVGLKEHCGTELWQRPSTITFGTMGLSFPSFPARELKEGQGGANQSSETRQLAPVTTSRFGAPKSACNI